jgi:hypothetical protein
MPDTTTQLIEAVREAAYTLTGTAEDYNPLIELAVLVGFTTQWEKGEVPETFPSAL